MSNDKKYTPEEIETAQNEIARAYVQAILELLYLSGHSELNFVKKSVELPNGGTYLLQLQHVTGPKLNIQELFSSFDDEKEKEPELPSMPPEDEL